MTATTVRPGRSRSDPPLDRTSLGGGSPVYPVLILFGLTAVDQFDKTAFRVLLPDIAKDLHLSIGSAFQLIALVAAAAILLSVPIGFAADRHRRVPIAIGGAVLWGAFSLMTGFANEHLAPGDRPGRIRSR